jgi:type I restriction enzyme, S subunit
MSKEHDADADSGPATLPPLPPGWCWTTLATIADIDGGITKDQKRRRTATMREVPYLRVANVQRSYLDLQEMKTILAENEEIAAMRLLKGDVLFTEGGDRDKLGRGWVVMVQPELENRGVRVSD